jgi:hypothetical protein
MPLDRKQGNSLTVSQSVEPGITGLLEVETGYWTCQFLRPIRIEGQRDPISAPGVGGMEVGPLKWTGCSPAIMSGVIT